MAVPDRIGPYQIVERISAGGMAEVYKAKQTGADNFEKPIAIKRILPHIARDPNFIGMFQAEAKLAVQLQHGENLVAFVGVEGPGVGDVGAGAAVVGGDRFVARGATCKGENSDQEGDGFHGMYLSSKDMPGDEADEKQCAHVHGWLIQPGW